MGSHLMVSPATSTIFMSIDLISCGSTETYSLCKKSSDMISDLSLLLFTTRCKSFTCCPPKIVFFTIEVRMIRYLQAASANLADGA